MLLAARGLGSPISPCHSNEYIGIYTYIYIYILEREIYIYM